MKKFLAMVLSLIMMVSIPVTCFAKEDTVRKTNTEFGTMDGYLSGILDYDRKVVAYQTKTTKTAARLIAFIDVYIYIHQVKKFLMVKHSEEYRIKLRPTKLEPIGNAIPLHIISRSCLHLQRMKQGERLLLLDILQ